MVDIQREHGSTMGTRSVAATTGIGGALLGAAGGVVNILDLAADMHLANGMFKDTGVGRESRARVDRFDAAASQMRAGTLNYLAQDGLGSALLRDAGSAVDSSSTYLGDVFIRGELTATSSWSGGMFEMAAGGAAARAARAGRVDATKATPRVITEDPRGNGSYLGEADFGPLNQTPKAVQSNQAAITGETASTSIGKQVHKTQADIRRESGQCSIVEQAIKDKAGNQILVPKRVDLKTGEAQADVKLQQAVPDAVNFDRRLIVDDKPLGRPIAKDRQEIIRFIEAFRQREGVLPEMIGIQRYDPKTGVPVRTDLHSPNEFLPK